MFNIHVSSTTYHKNLTVEEVRAAMSACSTRRIRIGCREESCIGRERVRLEFRPAQTCGIAICACPECVAHRKAARLKKYRPFVNSFKNPYFLTLTYQGHFEPNPLIVGRLNEAWRVLTLRLRREGVINGYLKVLEVAEDEYFDQNLNPVYVYGYHFHVVIDVVRGKRIDISKVREFWKFRFNSPMMRIDPVQSPYQLVRYVVDYTTKATYFDVDVRTYLRLRKMKFFSSWLAKGLERPEPEKFVLLCPFCRSIFGFLGECSAASEKWYFYDYAEEEPLRTIT